MDFKVINNHRLQCITVLILMLLTIVVLEFADSYAYYLRDVNTRPAFPWLGEVTTTPYSYMWRSFSIGMSAFEFFLFSQPFLAILATKNHPKLRFAWFTTTITLFIIALFTIGSGDDRKGCEDCLGVFYVYLFLLPIPTLVTIIYVLVNKIRYKKGYK